MKSEQLIWQPDGLKELDAGPWTEEKYRLLFNYIDMFSRGMKNAFKERIYIDLYSGPGCAKIRGTEKILQGSPLLAMGLKDPFDKYIFCDENIDSLNALQKRTEKHHPNLKVEFVQGDCNEKIQEIISKIPADSPNHKVLSFCFVDPFSLNIRFKTIELLANSTKADFLILLALSMDGIRNQATYTEGNNDKVDLFLGDRNWREKWSAYQKDDDSFRRFLAEEFQYKMLSIGYKKSLKNNTREIKLPEKNLSLYHLAFFSKHQRGYDFWEKGSKYGSGTIPLDF